MYQAVVENLASEQYSSRLPAVHKILYLLFTEGYLASDAEMAIRQELETVISKMPKYHLLL